MPDEIGQIQIHTFLLQGENVVYVQRGLSQVCPDLLCSSGVLSSFSRKDAGESLRSPLCSSDNEHNFHQFSECDQRAGAEERGLRWTRGRGVLEAGDSVCRPPAA